MADFADGLLFSPTIKLFGAAIPKLDYPVFGARHDAVRRII
jgi:hypothetical protein